MPKSAHDSADISEAMVVRPVQGWRVQLLVDSTSIGLLRDIGLMKGLGIKSCLCRAGPGGGFGSGLCDVSSGRGEVGR